MDFARRFVSADNDWNNRSLAQLSLQYSYSDLFAATDGFHEKNKCGTGSYGAVYKGVMGDGTEVAIKVMDLPSEAGFEDEVRVLSKFRHPNLVILMGFAVNGSQRILVYEYLSGGDVSRRLQKCARDNLPFTYLQRLSAALDAACGLSHLHNANPKVYHRDIKTANILLDRNGGAKMADFGLACLSRSSEHKVKQASGTIGYACPYYIQRGVVTEGSEVYSFGMVIIELLCNAPPACSGPNPGEILYLVNHLQGSVSRCVGMADPKAGWPPAIATKLAELAMSCVSMTETVRPKFVQIVKQLRSLLEAGNNGSPASVVSASPPPVVSAPEPTQRPPPLSPTKRGIELIKLEFVVPAGTKSDAAIKTITHTCTVEESLAATLPPLKVGRHCQSALFDALVPTDTLKGTISREHFVVSFQPVTRSAEKQFHATVTNNSINSISVNDKVLEKGQSSFIYTGDTLAFLALQPSAQSPTPFLSFRVDVLNSLIQSIRPQPVPFQPANLNKSASTASLPVSVSLPQSAEDLLNVTHSAHHQPALVVHVDKSAIDRSAVDKSALDKSPIDRSAIDKSTIEKPTIEKQVSEKSQNVEKVHSSSVFGMQVKGSASKLGAAEVMDVLGVKEPTAVLRVGRSYQPESFWRSLAPDACPAISREHFSISAVKQRSGSVGEDDMYNRRSGYRFYLCCNSLNGLAVLNPSSGGPSPAFLQKDTSGAAAYEIYQGTEIELAGIIRLVFHESLNSHNATVSTAAGSAPRSINFVPAAVLRPPVSVNTAHSVKGALGGSVAGSASASFIGDDESDIDDAFSKTGFRAAA